MLKTATPTSTHSFGSAGSGGSPPASSDSQPRGIGAGSRTYLDVFNPPLDAVAATSVSPGTSPALTSTLSPQAIGGTGSPSHLHEVSCSPSNYPSSFTAPAVPEHLQSGSGPSSSFTLGGQSPLLVFRGIPASPVINIRKTSSSASINRDLDDFHLGEALNTGHGSFGSGSSNSGVLHHHHHQQHYHHGHSPLAGAYSPRMAQRRQMSMSEITHEDLYAPATTEEIKNPDLFTRQGQNVDGPTTPPTDTDRRSSIQDLIVPLHPIEDTTISSSIPLYEVPQDMLVPLLDRASDMKRLLEHHSCDRQLHTLRNVVGDDVYETKLLPLWTATDRKDVSDAEWLWRTKCLILRAAGGEGGVGAREEKLWGDFCDIVGFDEEDTSIDRFGGPAVEENKPPSPAVDAMEKIGEEPEEEEVKVI